MQRVHLRTAVGILVAVSIVSASGISLSVAVCPCVALARVNCCGRMVRVVDGQVQGNYHSTVFRHVCIFACLCICRIMPYETITSENGRIARDNGAVALRIADLSTGHRQQQKQKQGCSFNKLLHIIVTF